MVLQRWHCEAQDFQMVCHAAEVFVLMDRLTEDPIEPIHAELMPLGKGFVQEAAAAVCRGGVCQRITVGAMLEDMSFVAKTQLRILLDYR